MHIRHRSEETIIIKMIKVYPKTLTILPLKSLFVSILSKFYVNLMSILGQNAITKSVNKI